MLISEMEAVLESLDRRVGRIEQILPALATRTELRDEIRGVKVLIEDARAEVRQLAESTDLGLKVLHDRIGAETAGLGRRMDDGFAALSRRMNDMVEVMQGQFAEVFRRLDRR